MEIVLRRHHLRHACLLVLRESGRPTRVSEVVDQLVAKGFAFAGRPTQAVSDALRSEARHGRVVRVDWGSYAFGRATDRHMRYAHHCVQQLRNDHRPG